MHVYRHTLLFSVFFNVLLLTPHYFVLLSLSRIGCPQVCPHLKQCLVVNKKQTTNQKAKVGSLGAELLEGYLRLMHFLKFQPLIHPSHAHWAGSYFNALSLCQDQRLFRRINENVVIHTPIYIYSWARPATVVHLHTAILSDATQRIKHSSCNTVRTKRDRCSNLFWSSSHSNLHTFLAS